MHVHCMNVFTNQSYVYHMYDITAALSCIIHTQIYYFYIWRIHYFDVLSMYVMYVSSVCQSLIYIICTYDFNTNLNFMYMTNLNIMYMYMIECIPGHRVESATCTCWSLWMCPFSADVLLFICSNRLDSWYLHTIYELFILLSAYLAIEAEWLARAKVFGFAHLQKLPHLLDWVGWGAVVMAAVLYKYEFEYLNMCIHKNRYMYMHI